MTTSERIELQSFCYDPDFPPDVAEGLPLASAVEKKPAEPRSVPPRRSLKRAAAALFHHNRA